MIRLVCLFLVHFVSCDRIVQTNSGAIRGIDLDGKNVDAFLGIPYAEPPVGNLRFARPVPKSSWKETFPANELPPSCVQFEPGITTEYLNESNKMNEDCLYLNLWVPKDGNILKPVMVFIHGGGFIGGSSNMKFYDGAALSRHGDVIVASMNYRVGTLGFFSGFINEAAGNMGMYDQVLAIQWIKDNAKYFGGDPDNILLFGESAGAMSISLHLVSPLSKKLFKRAILQSGSMFSPVYSDDNKVLRKGCEMVSILLGCASNDKDLEENPKDVVDCMKNLPPEKIAKADSVFFDKLPTGELMMIPRVGDEFLPVNPTDLFRKGEYKDTEVLFGITRNEGSLLVLLQIGFPNPDTFGEMISSNDFNETSAREIARFYLENEHTNEIVEIYFKRVEEESRYTYLNAVSDIIGDGTITCSTMFQADFQSLKSNAVYFYLFDYRSPLSLYPEWVGVTHFDEVPFVFGNPLLQRFSETEEELSKDMMDMWVAFARTGDPSIPGGLKWPKYTYNNPEYFIISKQDRIGVKPDNNRCEAWRDYYRATIDDKVTQKIKKSKS